MRIFFADSTGECTSGIQSRCSNAFHTKWFLWTGRRQVERMWPDVLLLCEQSWLGMWRGFQSAARLLFGAACMGDELAVHGQSQSADSLAGSREIREMFSSNHDDS